MSRLNRIVGFKDKLKKYMPRLMMGEINQDEFSELVLKELSFCNFSGGLSVKTGDEILYYGNPGIVIKTGDYTSEIQYTPLGYSITLTLTVYNIEIMKKPDNYFD